MMHSLSHNQFRSIKWLKKGALDQSSGQRDIKTLVLMCGCVLSVMLLSLAVVLPTPHDYSGTFQGGYTTKFTASRRAIFVVF